MGADMKRVKREGMQLVRDLSQRVGLLREYRGKEVVRDVVEYGDIIRSLSQIRVDEV